MKILVVSHKYPPSIGGMQKHCFELVNGLSKNHTVLTLVSGEKSKLGFFLTVRRRIKSLLKLHDDIDLVYLNDGLMAFVLGSYIQNLKMPVFMTAHGLDIVFPVKFYQKWINKKLSRLTGIVAVSEGTLNECLKRGIPKEKLTMVANAIADFEAEKSEFQFDFDPQKKYLVSLGRPVLRKGISWFLKNVFSSLPANFEYIIIGPNLSNQKMWEILKTVLPDKLFNLIIIFGGVAIDAIAIQKVIDEHQLKNRTHLLKGLKNGEVNYILSKSDIFVMPNISIQGDYEGFGLVLLEAISMGLPVIASRVDGIPTAIQHEKNGFLVESENSKMWMEKLQSKGLKDSIVAYQEFTKKNYSIDMMIQGYEDFFVKLSGRL